MLYINCGSHATMFTLDIQQFTRNIFCSLNLSLKYMKPFKGSLFSNKDSCVTLRVFFDNFNATGHRFLGLHSLNNSFAELDLPIRQIVN